MREFLPMACFLAAVCAEELISIPIMFFRKEMGLPRHLSFQVLDCSRWIAMLVEYALLLLAIYTVFSLAIRPLKGLHRVGKLVFRWVGGVSVLLAAGICIGPHLGNATNYIAIFAGRLQQGTSVLTLCLLVFVCLAIRPLGLTYGSRIFGITLGMGVFSTVSLITSAWVANMGMKSVYSPVYLISTLGLIVGLGIWTAYFAMPEPERKMIMLPTTSPYFFWNKLSEALGDPPGNVVVAGFRPEMLAKAEMENLKAASRRVRERERQAEADAAEDQAASVQLQTVSATH